MVAATLVQTMSQFTQGKEFLMQLVQLADCYECYCLMVDDGCTWCNLFYVRRLSQQKFVTMATEAYKLGSHQRRKQRRRRFILPLPLALPSVPVHTSKSAAQAPQKQKRQRKKKERFVPSVSVSVEHPLVLPSPFLWFTLEWKDSSVSVFMVHTRMEGLFRLRFHGSYQNVRILPSPFSWFTLERKDSSVSVFMVHTRT